MAHKRINLRMPDKKMDDLEKEAKEIGVSVNALILMKLKLEEEKEKKDE